jgi:hypothetical protein
MYVHHLEVSQKKLSGLGSNSADISIHIDYGVMEIIPDKSKINYAWLSENYKLIIIPMVCI